MTENTAISTGVLYSNTIEFFLKKKKGEGGGGACLQCQGIGTYGWIASGARLELLKP